MNAAYFLKPKKELITLYDDYTLRQGLERMRYHGYSEVPVTTRENQYVGTVREGDFLWCLWEKREQKQDVEKISEQTPIREILSQKKYQAVKITVRMDELLQRVMEQEFVPVVDDMNSFIGIITRKSVMRYYFSLKRLREEIND